MGGLAALLALESHSEIVAWLFSLVAELADDEQLLMADKPKKVVVLQPSSTPMGCDWAVSQPYPAVMNDAS